MVGLLHAQGNFQVQLPEQTHRLQIVESYNTLISKGYFDLDKRGNELYVGGLIESFIPSDAQSILEVGGATGLLMAQLLEKHSSLRNITSIEIADAARLYCDRIQKLLPPDGKLNVIQADFLQVASQLEPKQVVVSCFAAQYMGDTCAYLRQLYDLTASGGRVIFADVVTQPAIRDHHVSSGALIAGIVSMCAAYIQHRRLPPFSGMIRSGALYPLYQEPSFTMLNEDYHLRYDFPLAAWKAEQAKYPGAEVYNLGPAAMLIIPKP
jgi:predicted O-methyltransferase YrrM